MGSRSCQVTPKDCHILHSETHWIKIIWCGLRYNKDEESRSEASSQNKPRFEPLLQFMETERRHAERRLLLEKNTSEYPIKKNPREKPKNFSGGADGVQIPKYKCLIHPDASHYTRKCSAFHGKSVEGKLVFDLKALQTLSEYLPSWCWLSIPHKGATMQSIWL